MGSGDGWDGGVCGGVKMETTVLEQQLKKGKKMLSYFARLFLFILGIIKSSPYIQFIIGNGIGVNVIY